MVAILDASDNWQENSGLAVAWIVGMFVFGWAVNDTRRDETGTARAVPKKIAPGEPDVG